MCITHKFIESCSATFQRSFYFILCSAVVQNYSLEHSCILVHLPVKFENVMEVRKKACHCSQQDFQKMQ